MRKINFDMMHPAVEKRNIDSFKELLPDFYYTNATESRILKAINPLTRATKHRAGDDFFKVDAPDLRAWVPITLEAEDDIAYTEYRLRLDRQIPLHPYIYKYNLKSYGVFRSGIVKDGKQQYKLFKFLLNNGILSKDAIACITHMRSRYDKQWYFCISRNPIDFLFMSTDQSFSSCMNLESGHESCFYMACAALVADPNRAIAFVTDGKKHPAIIKGHAFNHFKYQCRTFLFSLKYGKVFRDRYYPNRAFDLDALLKQLNFNLYEEVDYADRKRRSKIQGKFNFITPRFSGTKAFPALPYFDHIGYISFRNEQGKPRIRLTLDGATGSPICFDYSNGFEDIEDWEDLYSGDNENYFNCADCGDRYHIDDSYSANDEMYCPECFHNSFFLCDNCGDVEDRDNIMEDPHGRELCQHCFDQNFFICDECGETEDINYMEDCPAGHLCGECYQEKYFEKCEKCGDLIDTNPDNDHNDPAYLYNDCYWYCETCFDEKIESVYALFPWSVRALQKHKRTWTSTICHAMVLQQEAYNSNLEAMEA